MNFKKEYKTIVETIKINAAKSGKRLRNEDIASRLGYDRTYFSTLMGARGKVEEQHIKNLKNEFNKELENTTPPNAQIEAPAQGQGDNVIQAILNMTETDRLRAETERRRAEAEINNSVARQQDKINKAMVINYLSCV